MYELVLASASPRRKYLLEKESISFTVFPTQVSEYLEKNLTLEEQVISIARRKAVAALDLYKPQKTGPFLILAADTMVALNQELLGKPEDPDQAKDFLHRLSGCVHQVYTALYLIATKAHDGRLKMIQQDQSMTVSHVKFRKLSREEIDSYVATGLPMDKAGAYGIQDEGSKFVEKIDGPYDNVVGLPIETFRTMLKKNGWKVS